MEHKLSNLTLYNVPFLTRDHEYDLHNIPVLRYEELHRNRQDTLVLITDIFYSDLYPPEENSPYGKLGRVRLFLNDADCASYAISKIMRNLPSNREHMHGGDSNSYDIVIADMALYKKERSKKYPFTLSNDANYARVTIVDIVKRPKFEAKKQEALTEIKRLVDF